ncbi:MAG: hypothetical protein WC538_21400 [Thermoanaerobaculia bacterium]|jgi:hypothetical protein
MRPFVSVVLGLFALAGTGCSSLASYESIAFESQPQGADVVVQCGATRRTTVTPGHVLLPRKAPDCLAMIHKEGFGEERIVLRRNGGGSALASTLSMVTAGGGVFATSAQGGGIEGEVAGEALISGLVPFFVNLVTCNLCDHGLTELRVVLRPPPMQASN